MTGSKRQRLEFAYDAQHRRIAKRVLEWSGKKLPGIF